MDWANLVTAERFSINDATIGKKIKDPIVRPHQKDVDRVLFCSAFRRMQGKAQVHILPGSDYIRNRLTHTLEVKSVSKLLSSSILRELRRYDENFDSAMKSKDEIDISDLSESISAACLAHDLGNAPFGHIGEFAIRSWFSDFIPKDIVKFPAKKNDDLRKYLQLAVIEVKDRGQSAKIKEDERQAIRNGFVYFDGNAQGFRLITEEQGWRHHGGLQLTLTTIGSFIKYPFSAKFASERGGKFGYFYDQNDTFNKIAKKLGMKKLNDDEYSKHPFSYIVEASDDIAYLTTDIEDGFKLRLISFEDAESVLLAIAKTDNDNFNNERYKSIEPRSQAAIKFLRSAAMIAMVKATRFAFLDNCENIRNGDNLFYKNNKIAKDLIDASSVRVCCKEIRKMCQEKLYFQRTKTIREAGAYEIIRSLLNMFSDAIEEYFEKGRKIDQMNDRNVNLLRILAKGKLVEEMWPENGWVKSHPNRYHAAYVTLLNFVAGMTDRYAARLNQELNGTALLTPSISG